MTCTRAKVLKPRLHYPLSTISYFNSIKYPPYHPSLHKNSYFYHFIKQFSHTAKLQHLPTKTTPQPLPYFNPRPPYTATHQTPPSLSLSLNNHWTGSSPIHKYRHLSIRYDLAVHSRCCQRVALARSAVDSISISAARVIFNGRERPVTRGYYGKAAAG